MKSVLNLRFFLGLAFIAVSCWLINNGFAHDESDPALLFSKAVDDFSIYWMFTMSALGLGAILILTEDKTEKAAYWSTRILMLIISAFSIFLVSKYDLGASRFIVYVLVIAALFVLVLSKQFSWLTPSYVVQILARVFTGSLFVVSGLIKANDPRGFGYKLEEYFDAKSLGDFWANFHDYALPVAILVATVEIVLGLAVLFGGKAKLVNWTLLGMALFFAWLTWFTASCNEDHDAFQKDKTAKLEEVKKNCGEWFDYKDEAVDSTYLPEEITGITNCHNNYVAVDTLNFERACVNDCGCFGDALKGSIGRSLTPWESFYKDITLLFYILVLLVVQRNIKLNTVRDDSIILPLALLAVGFFAGGLFGWSFPLAFTIVAIAVYYFFKRYFIGFLGQEWSIALGAILLSFGFTFYCYYYLPIKDFRPYAIGKNIIEEKTDIAPVLQFYYKLKNKATGEVKEFTEFPKDYEKDFEYIESRSEPIVEGKEAPARDFNIREMQNGTDITDSVLKMEKVIFLISYDFAKIHPALKNIGDDVKEDKTAVPLFNEMNEMYKQAKQAGVTFICLTATESKKIERMIKLTAAEFPICQSDEKVLKTMIRSNPGLMLLKKAVVIDMWPGTALPTFEEIKSKHLN